MIPQTWGILFCPSKFDLGVLFLGYSYINHILTIYHPLFHILYHPFISRYSFLFFGVHVYFFMKEKGSFEGNHVGKMEISPTEIREI